MPTLLQINTEDWSQGVFTDRDGSRWVVEGECDTDGRPGQEIARMFDPGVQLGEREGREHHRRSDPCGA